MVATIKKREGGGMVSDRMRTYELNFIFAYQGSLLLKNPPVPLINVKNMENKERKRNIFKTLSKMKQTRPNRLLSKTF